MSTKASPKSKSASPPDPNPLLEMALCIVLPTMLLTKGTKHFSNWMEDPWGPRVALLVAIALPIGYGIWDFYKRRTFNLFAVIGLIGVVATGVIGLMNGGWKLFALKEALMPLILGAAILLSHLGKNPLVRSIFLNPQLFAVKRIEAAVTERGTESAFKKLLFQGSLGLAGTMAISSVANWFLARHFLQAHEPGTEAYTEGIGRTMGYGFLVIGLPLLVGMLAVFWFLMKGMTRVTGLDSTELTEEGKTVKRRNTSGDSEE